MKSLFKNMTIKGKLWFGFSIGLVVLLLQTGVVAIFQHKLVAGLTKTNDYYETLQHISKASNILGTLRNDISPPEITDDPIRQLNVIQTKVTIVEQNVRNVDVPGAQAAKSTMFLNKLERFTDLVEDYYASFDSKNASQLRFKYLVIEESLDDSYESLLGLRNELESAASAAFKMTYDDRNKPLLLSLGLAGLFMILLILLSVNLVNRIRRPIDALVASVKKVAEGNLETKARVFANDEIGSLALSFNQMTESLRKTHEEREDARQMMVKSAKFAALGEMAGGIAHEINNPTAIIKGRSRQLTRLFGKEELSIDKAMKYNDEISSTADRISKIVKGLRSFSRNADGDPMYEESLKSIVEDTTALCHERFKNNGIAFKVADIPEGIKINCRATELSQVLLNILNNAHDAIEDLPEKWIDVFTELNEDRVRLIVLDSGEGIPKDIRDKILQPFFTTKPVNKGTGLGLSLSKSIIDDHGGRLTIDSSKKNTCFVIELPLLAAGGDRKVA